MVKANPKPALEHRYSFFNNETKQFIWIEIRSSFEYPNGRFDWTVWIKTESMSAPGVYRDKRFTLDNFPSDMLMLLVAMRSLIEEMTQPAVTAKRAAQ